MARLQMPELDCKLHHIGCAVWNQSNCCRVLLWQIILDTFWLQTYNGLQCGCHNTDPVVRKQKKILYIGACRLWLSAHVWLTHCSSSSGFSVDKLDNNCCNIINNTLLLHQPSLVSLVN